MVVSFIEVPAGNLMPTDRKDTPNSPPTSLPGALGDSRSVQLSRRRPHNPPDYVAGHIIGNQQLRRAAEKAEHAHMRAGPVRQGLRPGRLGVGEVRGAKHADENLRLADLSRRRIGDPDPLARIVDERLLAGPLMLA